MSQLADGREVTPADWRSTRLRLVDDEWEDWDVKIRPISWSEEVALVATLVALILVVLFLL